MEVRGTYPDSEPVVQVLLEPPTPSVIILSYNPIAEE